MKDLLETPDDLPTEARDILNRYELEDCTYDMCMALEEELRGVGYIIDWGLDAVPHSLRKVK